MLARVMNRISAVQFSAGLLSPKRAVTLEVPGRRTGRVVSFPLVVDDQHGERYLVAMLGNDANWCATSAPPGGRAVLRRGGRENVHRGARPHIPVDRRAPLADFERTAAQFPVLRVSANPSNSPDAPGRSTGCRTSDERDRRSRLIRRGNPPSPARHRGVCDDVGTRLRVLPSKPCPPLEVADKGGSELRILRQVGIIGGQAHQRREPEPLRRGDGQTAVVGEHALIATDLGVIGRAAEIPRSTTGSRARGAQR